MVKERYKIKEKLTGGKRDYKIYHNHIIYKVNPNIKSYGHLTLLNHTLKLQDVDYLEEINKRWDIVQFNISFLEEVLEKEGGLVCVYCGKRGLFINYNFGKRITKRMRVKLATVDHVIPTSKGGGQFNKNNMVCACWKCNQKKKDSIGYKGEDGKYYY